MTQKQLIWSHQEECIPPSAHLGQIALPDFAERFDLVLLCPTWQQLVGEALVGCAH